MNIHPAWLLLLVTVLLIDATSARHVKKSESVKEIHNRRHKNHKHHEVDCKEQRKAREKQDQIAKGKLLLVSVVYMS